MNPANPRKSPPLFSSTKSYENWRKELNAWTRITTEQKRHWAPLIALSLPDNDPSGIRDKVFALDLDPDEGVEAVPAADGVAAIPAIPANEGAGYDRLMAFMDSEFKKDNLTDMCEHIRLFMKMTKKKETTMKQYISDFEAAYKKAKEKGLPVMPHKFLMWSLLESVHISDQEYMLVISGIPPESLDMYEAAKQSLLRFFNSPRNLGTHSADNIAYDPSLDTHYGRGYQGQRGGSRGGGYGGGYGARGRGGGRSSSPWRNPNTKGGQSQEAFKSNKPMNPLDKDGKPYNCNSCGSYRHFSKDCQHNLTSGTHYGEEAHDGSYDPNGDPTFNEPDNHEQVETHFVGLQLYDVLFTTGDYEDVYLSQGSINILMDTGCPKTVAGVKWLKQLIASMTPEARSRVKKYPSSASFRFGGKEVKRSLGFYTLPINVAGKNLILQTEVVSSSIPCLVSKAAMKKAGGIINLEEDSIRLFGKFVHMNTNASGHYTLPVEQYEVIEGEENKVFIVEHERPEYNEMQIHKMHKALGHPSRAAFEATIKAANVKVDNLNLILSKLYESCLICLKFSKAHVRPKVGLPIATDFNQTICLDLKIWPSRDAIILYIIDAFSRFQQAHVIPDKKAETILEKLTEGWILGLYGAPENILVDNGGEFYNQHFKDLCNNMNIRLYASSAESPWQNGLCERNHSLTDKIMEKMFQEDSSLTVPRALSAATFAKNCLVNVNGYCPIQLVTGKMPRLPGVLTNNLPAQEAVSSFKPTSDRINAIFSGRKIFMEQENSKRLNQALKTKVIPPIEHYDIGDSVYFKKQGKFDTPWQGPAKVMGVNGKTIFLAMGRFTYSTSRSRLIKIPRSAAENVREVRDQEQVKTPVTEKPQEQVNNRDHDYESDSDDEDVIHDKVEPQVNNPGRDPVEDFPDPDIPDPIPQEPALPAPPSPAQLPALDNPAQPPTPPNTDPDKREERLENEADVGDLPNNQEEEREMENSKTKPHQKKKGVKLPYPKKGQEIFFRVKSTRNYGKIHPAITTKYADNWVNATILGKVYKDSQKSGPYFNFKDKEDGFEGGIHLDQTQWTFSNTKPLPRTLADSIHNYLVEDDPQLPNVYTVQVARDKWHLPEVREAMKKELDNFAKFDVYDLVPDRGQHFITSGWVVVEKEKEGNWITKARLVIHGNQERDTVRSDSPTVKKQNLRIQLALAVQNNWTMCSADVQAAFLQAVSLDREIFVKPVVEADNPGLLWKLKKPMYGLEDSGRLWYITITDFLRSVDCQMLVTDLACLYWHKDGILHGIITIHVDDIQYCGSPDFEEALIKPMLDKFKFGMIQRGEFKCLGWDLQQYETHLTVDQIAYAEDKIKPVEIELANRPNEEKLNSEEITLMRGITGKLRWMDQTRADLCYDLLELSMIAGKAAVKDAKMSTKAVNHVKNTPLKIKFNKLDGDEWYVSVYPDAAKNTLPDGESSAMGFIIFLSNGHVTGEVRKVCPLYWKSAKILRIVGSSFEGEAIALEEGLNVAFTIMKDLAAITGIPEDLIKVEALCDCDDVVKAVNATTQKSGLGRTSWEIGRIRQMIEKKEVTRVKWHEGQSNVADVLTKRGASKHLMIRALEQGVV